jgi:hypothetical protein
MSRALRRFAPIVAVCLATLLGGCVVVPAHSHYWGPGWGWHR